MNATMFNCHKLFIDGDLFAIVHTYDEAFMLLEILNSSGMCFKTHAVKAAYVPDVGF